MTSRPLRRVTFVTLAVLAAAVPAAAAPAGPERDQRGEARSDEGPRPMDTHVYLNGGVGYGHVDLSTFVARESGDRFTADLIPMTASGPVADLGLGLRLSVLTAGLRGRVLALEDSEAARSVGGLQLWSLDLELGLRIPFGRVEGHIELAGGYSKFGGLNDALSGVRRGIDIDGANLGLGLGVDYFVSQWLSLGGRAGAEALFLSRRAVPLRELARMEQVGTISEAKARALEGDGTTVGTAYQILVGPGLHF